METGITLQSQVLSHFSMCSHPDEFLAGRGAVSNRTCMVSTFVSSDEQLIAVLVMSDMPELIHGKQSRVEGQL